MRLGVGDLDGLAVVGELSLAHAGRGGVEKDRADLQFLPGGFDLFLARYHAVHDAADLVGQFHVERRDLFVDLREPDLESMKRGAQFRRRCLPFHQVRLEPARELLVTIDVKLRPVIDAEPLEESVGVGKVLTLAVGDLFAASEPGLQFTNEVAHHFQVRVRGLVHKCREVCVLEQADVQPRRRAFLAADLHEAARGVLVALEEGVGVLRPRGG